MSANEKINSATPSDAINSDKPSDDNQQKTIYEMLPSEELVHQLLLMLNATDEGIYTINLQGSGTFINNAGARMLGYNPKDLLKMQVNWHDLIHHSYPDGTPYPIEKCIIYDAFKKGFGCRAHNEVFWRQDGTSFPVEYSSYPIFENGKIKGAVVTFRDISRRLQIENEVRLERDKYKKLLEEMKEVQMQLVESEKMAALGILVAGIAHELNTPLGSVKATVSLITNYVENILDYLSLVSRKLSPEKLQEYLLLVQKTKNKAQSIADKSYLEKNNIKNAIISQLQSENIPDVEGVADTLMDMEFEEELTEILPYIKESADQVLLQFGYNVFCLQRDSQNALEAVKRASKFVHSLKSYSHYEHSGEKTTEDICNNIDMVLTLHYHQLKHGIEVVKNYHEKYLVPGYHDELNQVWSNLVNNAIYAMKNRGTLIITVKKVDSHILVEFNDTGQGISKTEQKKIFNPFFTTKPRGEGTGLGLYIAQKIVEKHQGKILLTSSPGNTTFTVKLPIDKQK